MKCERSSPLLCFLVFSLLFQVQRATNPLSEMEMECLDGIWEPIEGNKKYRYIGSVRFTLRPPEYPTVPTKTFVTKIRWIQPTSDHYIRVASAPMMEISSSEDSTEEEDDTRTFTLESLSPPPLAQGIGSQDEGGFGWWLESSESKQDWMSKWRTRSVHPRDPTLSRRIPSLLVVDSSTTSDGATVQKEDGVGPSRTAEVTSFKGEEVSSDGDDQ